VGLQADGMGSGERADFVELLCAIVVDKLGCGFDER
jgi:hypothetical protein